MVSRSRVDVGWFRTKRDLQNDQRCETEITMTKNDVLTALSAATATAALTITTFWPGPLDAGDPQPLPPKIAQPKLVANGVEISLAAAEGRTLTAGEEPVFELAALNTNSISAQVKLHMVMSATSPADSLSRVVRTPGVIWQTDQTLTLGPKEGQKLKLSCATKLPPFSLISVLLQETASGNSTNLNLGTASPGNGIVALTFSTFPGRQQPERPRS